MKTKSIKLNEEEIETIYTAISRIMETDTISRTEFNFLDTLRDKFKT